MVYHLIFPLFFSSSAQGQLRLSSSELTNVQQINLIANITVEYFTEGTVVITDSYYEKNTLFTAIDKVLSNIRSPFAMITDDNSRSSEELENEIKGHRNSTLQIYIQKQRKLY